MGHDRAAFNASLATAARQAGDQQYDASYGLVAEPAAYNPIHTRLWTGIRHPYRESMQYSLALLETREPHRTTDSELAAELIIRIAGSQDVDESSSTYGIWSYYDDEPLDRMSPPDWNWADFLGRDLSLILLRHGAALSTEARAAAENALRHAARSVIRRNVAMSYTNIAAKGTFVTLAAGQLLDDADLTAYGVERVGRLVNQVTEAGSFAEFNSPGYWAITTEAIGSIVQYVTTPAAREGAQWLLGRLWEHFTRRWHSPTGQLSGPMARAYTNDQRRNPTVLALLAKAVDFAGPFGELPRLEPKIDLIAPAVIDVVAPDAVRDAVLASPTGTVRERFSVQRMDDAPDMPITGTTSRGATATIGSVNLAEYWLQRRPVLGYWTAPGTPAWQPPSWAQLRMLKNDFDFSSGMSHAVQSGPHVLWGAGLKSPGGDEHVHLFPIEAGARVRIDDLRLRLDLVGPGLSAGSDLVAVDGAPVTGDHVVLEAGQTVTVAGPGVALAWHVAAAVVGDRPVSLSLDRTDDGWQASVVLLSDVELALLDLGRCFVIGTLSLADAGTAVEPGSVLVREDGAEAIATWTTPHGAELTLTMPARVSDVAAVQRCHRTSVVEQQDQASV